MAYVVQASERTKGIGAEFETKSMLYLMNCRDDSDEINFFAIDFYNDVTGLNNQADKAWDLQSKGTKSNSAKAIGRELVTLFKNEMSELKFDYLVLFLADVPDSFRIDKSKNTFGIENITDKSLLSVRKGLIDEARKKTYIEEQWINNTDLDSFLNKVTFVVDNKTKADYIRSIMCINPKYIPQDCVLDGIFNTIRDAQAGKKNNDSVEGQVVTHLRDVFRYDRSLKSKEIRLMVLNSFINRDVIKIPAPFQFYTIIQRFDGIKQKEIIEDCKLQISAVLCDKTYTDEFWKLLELILETVTNNKGLSTEKTFDIIADNRIVKNPRLDVLTIQYLIAVIKEALQ